MSFKKYQEYGGIELRPVTQEDLKMYKKRNYLGFLVGDPFDGKVVEISIADVYKKQGSPKLGDMIMRAFDNKQNQWLVSEEYLKDNYKPFFIPEIPKGETAESISEKINETFKTGDGWKTHGVTQEKNVEKFEGLSGPNIDLAFPDRSYVQFESEEAILAAIADKFGFEREGFKMISGIRELKKESVTVDCCRMVGKFKASIGGFDFGKAVQFAKNGKKVARAGWNGKDMFVYYVPAASYPAMTGVAKEIFGLCAVPYREYLALKTAQGDVATWAPSGSDALAEDWMIVE